MIRSRTAAFALVACALAGLIIAVGLLAGSPSVRALPPAGTDVFSANGVVAASSRLGSENIALSGTVWINRGEPHLEGGLEVVDAEIVFMSLTGTSVTGPIAVSLNPALQSFGEIRSLQPPPVEFPASSFFDVYVTLTAPASPSGTNPIALSNAAPLHMVPMVGGNEVPLNAWPPLGVTFRADPNPPGGSGAEAQTYPPGAPHCASGLPLFPPFPAKVCIDSISIVISGVGTPTPAPTKQPDPGDTDQDGCSDVAENGLNARFGGRRDYLSFWDFYDVWTHPAGEPQVWARDRVITLFDILGVARRFGPGPFLSEAEAIAGALTPPTSASGYHPAYDRGGLLGLNPWDRAPPDGAIDIPDDILGVAAQFGHTCA